VRADPQITESGIKPRNELVRGWRKASGSKHLYLNGCWGVRGFYHIECAFSACDGCDCWALGRPAQKTQKAPRNLLVGQSVIFHKPFVHIHLYRLGAIEGTEVIGREMRI
jgi:hypothetical protein